MRRSTSEVAFENQEQMPKNWNLERTNIVSNGEIGKSDIWKTCI